MNFAVIDWQRPWLTHLRELGGMISSSSDWMSVANQVASQQGLTNANAKLISFVPLHSADVFLESEKVLIQQ